MICLLLYLANFAMQLHVILTLSTDLTSCCGFCTTRAKVAVKLEVLIGTALGTGISHESSLFRSSQGGSKTAVASVFQSIPMALTRLVCKAT